MPTAGATQINKLLDDLGTGAIPVLDFMRGLSQTPESRTGLGAVVQKSTGAVTTLKGGFVRTHVVLRIKSVDPNGDNVIEGAVLPGAAPLTQFMRHGQWHQMVKAGHGQLGIGGSLLGVAAGSALTLPAATKFEFANTSNQPWQFEARHSSWHPDTFAYEYQHQMLSGEDLWFEIKTAIDDKTPRPIYNIRAYDGGTYAVVYLDPGQTTLACYYSDGSNTVTGLLGSGQITVGKGGQAAAIARGAAVPVPANQPFQITNNSKAPMMAEIRPDTPRAWLPQTSFWETQPGKFVTGDVVYFAYVVPTP